jgi:hypothetical protein
VLIFRNILKTNRVKHIDANSKFFRLSVALGSVHALELFVEIFSKNKWGQRGRWISVFVVELLKYGRTFHKSASCFEFFFFTLFFFPSLLCRVLIKLKMLLENGGRIFPHQIPHFRDEASIKNYLAKNAKQELTPSSELHYPTNQKVRETRRTSKNLHKSKPPSGDYLHEVAYILRSLVYCRLVFVSVFFFSQSLTCFLSFFVEVLSMYVFGVKSWKAWSTSLLFELFALSPHFGRTRKALPPHEQDEIEWRKWALAYYLLRSPFFEAVYKPSPLQFFFFSCFSSTDSNPLLSQNWIDCWQSIEDSARSLATAGQTTR